MSTVLANPAWQGVGVLVAAAGVFVSWLGVKRRRRKTSLRVAPDLPERNLPTPLYFPISPEDPESERRFYEHLVKGIRNANAVIYRLGDRFQDERRMRLFPDLLSEEENALRRGVRVVRVQTSSHVAKSWADRYAGLLQQYPENLTIAIDFESKPLNDVIIIDPNASSSALYLVTESSDRQASGGEFAPAVVQCYEGAGWYCRQTARNFLAHCRHLTKLQSSEVRDLGRTYLYFGWGVHMHSEKMLRDVPSAEKVGTAILKQWKRDIKAILAGPADRASILPGEDTDFFDGVAYRLSWWGVRILDRLESRAYKAESVKITINEQELDAFTYVPLPSAAPAGAWSKDSWIELVVAGANENGMSRLLSELREAGVPTDRLPSL